MTGEILSQSEQKKLLKKEYDKLYYLSKKAKITDIYHSKYGLITTMYKGQKRCSKLRNHSMPDYSKEELETWVFSQPNFDELYQAWVDSDFKTMQKPSCDRLDDYKPYTLDNIRLVTWEINKNRGHTDTKNGINNKRAKPVLQLTREGIVFAEYHSARHAARITGINQGHLSACCCGNNRYKVAGNFVWCFAY